MPPFTFVDQKKLKFFISLKQRRGPQWCGAALRLRQEGVRKFRAIWVSDGDVGTCLKTQSKTKDRGLEHRLSYNSFHPCSCLLTTPLLATVYFYQRPHPNVIPRGNTKPLQTPSAVPSAAMLASRRLKFSRSFPKPQPVPYSTAPSLNMLAELSKVGPAVNTREDAGNPRLRLPQLSPHL